MNTLAVDAVPFTRASYSIEVWDCSRLFGDFSALAAAELLGRPATGLSWRELGKALRVLRELGFDDLTVFVCREAPCTPSC